MSLRDQYKSAVVQQQEIEAEVQRKAFFPYTPAGMMQCIDEGLAEIAGKVEDDIAARIATLCSGKRKAGPLAYRIEKISNLSADRMKTAGKLKGYQALRDVCGKPGNDVRVDVVLHHGCLNGGVDIRVYPDQPFSKSTLSIDGIVAIRHKFPAKRKAAAKSAPAGQIAVLKPIVFARPTA